MKYLFLISFLISGLFSCTENQQGYKQHSSRSTKKVEKINKERCAFDLPVDLYLGRTDGSLSEEGYFKIESSESNNILQLFVYNTQIDIEEHVNRQQEALNSDDIFTAATIDTISRLGSYDGKGVVMKGAYAGGVVNGEIKIFCFSNNEKGFLIIRQTINKDDSQNFDIVEKSFLLK